MTKKQDELLELKVKGGCGVVIFIVIIIMCFSFLCNDADEEIKEPPTPEQGRTEMIAQCFSAWDGSHMELTEIIKSSMNDPDSYEHVETNYWDWDSVLLVRTTFRGRNAFGGVVNQTVSAYTNMRCTVIEVIN